VDKSDATGKNEFVGACKREKRRKASCVNGHDVRLLICKTLLEGVRGYKTGLMSKAHMGGGWRERFERRDETDVF